MSGDLRQSRPFDRMMDLADCVGAQVGLEAGALIRRPDGRENFRPLTCIVAAKPTGLVLRERIVAGNVDKAAAVLTPRLAS